jgi:hypothetical protein
VKVDLRRTGRSAREAEALLAAIRADTPDFVALSTDGPTLRIRLAASSAGSARATLEDLLACLQAAERAALPLAEKGPIGTGRTEKRGKGLDRGRG